MAGNFTTDGSGGTMGGALSPMAGGVPSSPFVPNFQRNISSALPSLGAKGARGGMPDVGPFAYNMIENGALDIDNTTTGVTVKAVPWERGWFDTAYRHGPLFVFTGMKDVVDGMEVMGTQQMLNSLFDEAANLEMKRLQIDIARSTGKTSEDIVNMEKRIQRRYRGIMDRVPDHDLRGNSQALMAKKMWRFFGWKGDDNAGYKPGSNTLRIFMVETGPNVRMPNLASVDVSNGDHIYAVFKQRLIRSNELRGPDGQPLTGVACESERMPLQISFVAAKSGPPMALSNVGVPAEDDVCYLEYCCPIKPRYKKWVKNSEGEMELKDQRSFPNPQNAGTIFVNGILQTGAITCLGAVWEYNDKSAPSLKLLQDAERNVASVERLGFFRLSTQ